MSSLNHYESKKKLGQGGNGEVWLVVCRLTNQKQAMKKIPIYNDLHLEIGLKEPKRLIKFDHPYLIKLYDFQFNKNWIILFMEYSEQGDLQKNILV